ncbi:MAG TPA: hypothetical protein VE134_04110, partial [Methanomicrobiales archaeon]|nr:hypothetical protein [Methanomicrobiales archaeon]
SLRQQLRESILEGLVRIGCLLFAEAEPEPEDSAAFAREVEPFERTIQLLKEQKNRHQIALKLARYIDIVLEYKQSSKNPGYIVPLAMFILEIESPLERNAMIYRVSAHFKDFVEEMDSPGPNEVMVDLLQRLEQARTSITVMNLTYRFLMLTADSYLKFSKMANLADSYLSIKKNRRAQEILHAVHESVGQLRDPFEQVMILADLAGLLGRVDEEEARACLNEAFDLLGRVDEERSSQLRRQLVLAIVSIQAISPRDEYIDMMLDLVEQIQEPTEYVNALVAIFPLVIQSAKGKGILRSIYQGIMDIPLPYDRASMLLDVIPLAETYGEKNDSLALIGEAEKSAEDLQIPFISTMVKKGIVQLLLMLNAKRGDDSLRKRALKVASSIPDEQDRDTLLAQIGGGEEIQKSNAYRMLREAYDSVEKGRFTVQDASAVDRTIRSLPDRSKRAQYAVELAL